MAISFDQLLVRFEEHHGDVYGYSLSEDSYKNLNSKIRIICPDHGVFEQVAVSHMNGSGCRKCKYEKHGNSLRKDTENVLDDFKKVHGDRYDYSKVVYKGKADKVEIICKQHGSFLQSPNHHMRNRNCPKCGMESTHQHRNQKVRDEFIQRARDVHRSDFEYLEPFVDSQTKILIKCNKCGLEFKQKPHNHLSGNGCPHCKMSKGEKALERWLIDNDIEYESEKIFPECRGKKRPLPFDFWLPNINTLVEFQGRHHYECVNFSNSEKLQESLKEIFENTKLNDEIKRKFCLDNQINLSEIPYTEIDNIRDILFALVYKV
jgi:hypothetical protein